MRSILVLLILVMIGLNGKGQSVTALPDSVLSQCCLEVTLLNGNVTTVDWVFIQYITRDGTGTKLFVEYAPNFGGIQWETQIRIQDDFDDVLERSKFIMLPFTVGSTDYAINRNWIANIEENTTTGGTWVYGRFGTPTKRKFSAVEDYETLKNLLLACRPRAIIVAENGLYTEGDTVRMGGFLIEPTTITTEGYNWQMKDTASTVEFGIDYNTPGSGDTTAYFARRFGVYRQLMAMGRTYWTHRLEDTTGVTDKRGYIINALDSESNPYASIYSRADNYLSWFLQGSFGNSWTFKDFSINPYYTFSVSTSPYSAVLGASESGTGDPGNGVSVSANGFGIGADEWIGIRTKNVDNGLAHPGQFLQLVDSITGKVEYATLDLSSYLEIGDTAAMLNPYISLAGYGLIKSAAHTLRADTSKVATRYYISTLGFGSGTADRLARWTGTNTLAAGNLSDNGTRLQALLPWQFQSWTTAGRPTGVNNYWGYNSTTDWLEGYLTTAGAWVSPLQSSLTGGKGTATRIPFFDASGRVTDNSGLYRSTSGRLNISSSTEEILVQALNSTSSTSVALVAGNGSAATTGWVSIFRNNSPVMTFNNNKIIFNPPNWQGGSATTGVAFQGGFGGANLGTSFQMQTGATNAGPFTATSGTQVNLRIGGSNNTWQSSSGNATWNMVKIDGTLNTSGTYSGIVRGVYYDPTITNTTGVDHRAIETGAGNVIVQNGKVGIGTTTPEFAMLRVRDAVAASVFSVVESANNFISLAAGNTGNPPALIFQDNQDFRIATAANYYGIGFDAQWIFRPNGSYRMRRYGVAAMEASDLSKTQSNYIAGFATDGTVLDLNIGSGLAISGGSLTATASAPTQILAEEYNTITSTSSPQTLSSTKVDNLINQGGTQASFTFNFPASPVDGQRLTITYNNAISALTLNGNGNTIVGTAVTTATAGSQRVFKFYTGIGWIRQN